LVFVPEFVNQHYLETLDSAATTLGVQVIRFPYHNPDELERVIDSFAAKQDGGLIIMPPPPRRSSLEVINRLALKYPLPTVSAGRARAAGGVMISYGGDSVEPNRIAATYVDRLLRGTKVSDLPVQFPTKFVLVVNLKTAKEIGLTIPEAFLLRADEIIE